MIPYIILSLILAFAVVVEIISKGGRYTFISERKSFFIVFILLFAYACLRDISVGVDFARYEDNFINYGGLGLSSDRLEPAWYFIYTFFYENANFRIYVFFFYVTLYYFLLKFVWKESRYPLLAVLLYVLLGHYFDSYNIMRQSFVVALFVMHSAIYIEKRNLIIFSGLILIGSLFHLSAVLFLPMYFVAHWVRNHKTTLITLLISTLVIGYFRPYIFYDLLYSVSFVAKYEMYSTMTRDYISFMGWFVISVNSAIAIVSLIIVKEGKTKYYMSIYVIGSCLNNLFYQYERLFRFYRPLLLIFMIIALPNLISDIKTRSLRVAYTALIILYGVGMFYTILKHNDNGVVPYELYFK